MDVYEMLSEATQATSLISFLLQLRDLWEQMVIPISARAKGQAFYFKKYHKDVVVDKDGNGLISNCFILHIIDPKNVKYISREITIFDSKTNTEFPSLKAMLKNNRNGDLANYGFWYSSEQDILQSVDEKCPEDVETTSESLQVNSRKRLCFTFSIDSTKLKKGADYKAIYVCSIPGLFPIVNGKFGGIDVPYSKYGKYTSSIKITHLIKKLVFTIRFMNGIKLHSAPQCSSVFRKDGKTKKKKAVLCEHTDWILQKKYVSTIRNPKFSNTVKIEWEIAKSRKYRKNSHIVNNV